MAAEFERRCDHELTAEDYRRLPETAKAYEGTAENHLMKVTPSVLKFPLNDTSLHLLKLVLWNKTKKRLDFRLEMTTHSNHFALFYEKTAIYGGGEETVLVKVKPYDRRMISTTLKIQVGSGGSEADAGEISVPVELFPDSSWFQLPRFIIMPNVPIGKCFDAVLSLPSPPNDLEDGLYFFVSNGKTDTVTVSPAEGTICAESCPDTLQISYHPREYITVAHTLFIHFPSIHKKPYEVTLFLRCRPPPFEKDDFYFPPIPIKKLPLKATKLRKIENKEEMVKEFETEDLTTPAAVVKFLLKPSGNAASLTDLKGPTGLTLYEEHKAYKLAERKFYEKVAQLQTLQQNLHLQPSRALVGDEALEEQSGLAKEIGAERDKHQFLYNKWLGVAGNDLEDLTRRKPKLACRRGLRDLDDLNIPEQVKPPNMTRDLVKQHILRPFIQAALTVITRQRAAKRIQKLRILIKQKRSEQGKSAK